MPAIPATQKWKQEDQDLEGSPGKVKRPCLKRKNRAGGVAQVVEYLPSMNEALSSIPALSLSLSLSLTHTHTHKNKKI
jgi:hypothetical protein